MPSLVVKVLCERQFFGLNGMRMKNNDTDILLEYCGRELSSSSMHFQKDEFVFTINAPSDMIYLIEKGSVKLAKTDAAGQEVIKAILGEGNVFGELALSGENKRPEYAVVISNDTVVRVMVAHELLEASKHDDVLFARVLGLMGNRIERQDRRLESITSKDSRTRIVDFLKDLALENGQKIGYETLVQNNFTHKDIACLTGTSRQTVTTTLNQLKDKNVINFDRRRILIRDVSLLV